MKKKNLKSLTLNKKSISKFNTVILNGGGHTQAIRCGHTIGNGQDQNGNPCDAHTVEKGCVLTNEIDENGLHIC